MRHLSVLIAFLVFYSCKSTSQEKLPSSSGHFNAQQLLEDLKYLSSDELEGRLPGTKGSEAARNYILNRFRQEGVDSFPSGYLQQFKFEGRGGSSMQGVNIIGVIKGTKYPDKYIVVTGHYDHVGVRGTKVYNGSDDNASGSAALAAIGSYFKKHAPEHSIILVALDAEEQGLRGAKYFVENPPVAIEKIILNINNDMIGRDADNKLYAVGTYHYPFLKKSLEGVAKNAKINLLFGYDTPGGKEDWTSQSDHYEFHKKKIPFIYFGVEDFAHHHQHTDDYETMTLPFYVQAVETIINAIRSFDKDAVLFKGTAANN